MLNSQALRGLFLVLISALFGFSSLDYKIGQFSKAGPGLFPLVISSMLFLIGLAMVIKSRFIASEPLHFNPKKNQHHYHQLVRLCGFIQLFEYDFWDIFSGFCFHLRWAELFSCA
jgi:hypothetical protein